MFNYNKLLIALKFASYSMALLIIHIGIVMVICKIAGLTIEGFLFVLFITIFLTSTLHRYLNTVENK